MLVIVPFLTDIMRSLRIIGLCEPLSEVSLLFVAVEIANSLWLGGQGSNLIVDKSAR